MKPSALRKPGNPAGTAKAAAALARFANGQLGTGDYDKRVAAVLGKQPGAQQTAKRLVQALETLRCPYLSRCRRPPPWVERVWVDLDGDALAAGRRGCGVGRQCLELRHPRERLAAVDGRHPSVPLRPDAEPE